ncbi:sensor histidine kinase [Colwellia sp. M166]|uniref:sensor histidine kinase n=1 Tax=Colwellia sp. M166 TaxID=2583805 RepID=UPI00211EA42B|nr:ATP-binding protein [Colwellia sp. M166]|tara:strand:+ start:66234 stop:67847 length:1614 start_codon:yes stop_codon:yes gene_type:complete
MPPTKRIWSIRRIFLISIIGFVSLLSIVSISILAKQYINSYNILASSHIKYWASVVADESRDYLVNSERQALNDNLSISEKIPNLNYLHIYQLNKQAENTELFYSYKRNQRRSAITEKSNDYAHLSVPRFREKYVEYMQAIKVDENVIGFIYLQSSTEHITLLTDKLLITSTVLIIIIIIIVTFIALQLERYISAPFFTLINTIQIASRQKNFRQQCQAMPYREADMLSQNINILFTRMEKHIAQLDAAEQQSIEHSHELEDKINKRTAALKESNQDLLSTLEKLHQFQGQLVESEKMASLGDMVAGVAHEVNTPIGLGVTASTLLADRLEDIKTNFENKTLKSSQLKKFLNEGSENVAIIYRNLNRAADLISSFKKVAVDQSSEEVRTFKVKELLSEVLLTLRPKLHCLPYVIDIDCPDNLTIVSKPGPINQILINLVMNSIIHGFEGREAGRISITVMPLSNQLNILFKDDGHGVNESIKNKVFEPFTTTKRGEGGSGLGLHLVYNLVTQALGGSIVLNSELGKGVSIEINFPIN